MLATTGGLPEFEDLSMGNEEYSSEIQAATIWFGVFDFTSTEKHYIELKGTSEGYLEGNKPIESLFGFPVTSENEIVKNASPITHIHKNMPPMLLQQGTSDSQVPYLQAIDFYKKYIKICGDKNIHLDLLEGAVHGDNAFRLDENLVKVIKFMDKNIMGVNNRKYGPIPTIPRVE
jgi:dipeptidyl aminopeptidase/acylaminoacyl peptidase